MDHLTSPKLTHGVHCLNIRHKGMFVTSGPDPDEFTFYDRYDSTAYWCAETQRGFGPDGAPVNPDKLRQQAVAGAIRGLRRSAFMVHRSSPCWFNVVAARATRGRER